MADAKRLAYLQRKFPKGQEQILEEKYRKRFEKNARYIGHGVYDWQGLTSTDTAELFLIGVLTFEGISFKQSAK